MGSLSSAPPPTPPEHNPSGHLIMASFCLREPGPRSNISNWIECYNPCNKTWSHVSHIPDLLDSHVLKGFSMVSVGDDSIYIIGGLLCHKERAHNNSDESSSDDFVDVYDEVLPWVLRYNVKSNEWTKRAPLSVPRYDFACTVCDDKIYVAGGKTNLFSAKGTATAEVYHPELDRWTPLPSMTMLRYKSVGVTWQGKIHVVSGFAERAADSVGSFNFTERSSAEVYDPQAGKWDLVARMWRLDIPPNQIVAVDNRLFSSGDCLKAWKGHIESYDGKLNMWDEVDGSCLQILSSPVSTSSSSCTTDGGDDRPSIQRLYLTMAPIGTHLYFLAGYRMAGELARTMSMVHIFDTAAAATNDAWRSFEPLVEEGEKELCSHCCVVQLSS